MLFLRMLGNRPGVRSLGVIFPSNTAAFIHELPAGELTNVDGESKYVPVQVRASAGALDRESSWRHRRSSSYESIWDEGFSCPRLAFGGPA